MKPRQLSLPMLALIGGTRAAFGAGLGLLCGERLTAERRQQCGWALIGAGILSTIPLALVVFRSPVEQPRRARLPSKRSSGRSAAPRRQSRAVAANSRAQ